MTTQLQRVVSSSTSRSPEPKTRRRRRRSSIRPGPEKEAEADRALLSSLIESQHWKPALKAVFDRGWETKYKDYISININEKDHEIKQICNDHYEEFIGSVDSLLSTKQEIKSLKEDIVEFNKNVQITGEGLTRKGQELMDCRLVRQRINDTIEVFSNINYLLNLVAKASEQIKATKYFSALKTLDQILRLHLPQFSDYEFAKHLEQEIPRMRKGVKDTVTAEFRKWLARIPESAKAIGAMAMAHTEQQMLEEEKRRQHSRRGREKKKRFSNSVRVEEWDEEGLFDRAKLDFAPLYQCMHIYEALNDLEQFKTLFRKKRKAQAQAVYDIPNMSNEMFQRIYREYFTNLAGFFIVQDAVFKSGTKVLNRSYLEELWELAMGKIKIVLHEQFNYLTDPELFLAIKDTVILFCKTIEVHGYATAPLMDFLCDVLDKFETVLFNKLRKEVKELFDAEKYESFTAPTYKEYQEQVLSYGLQDVSTHVEYPARMPFSITVPAICKKMDLFISQYFRFGENLNKPIDSFVVVAVDRAMSKEVKEMLNDMIDKSPSSCLHISQAVQFSINAHYLAEACNFLEQRILFYSDQKTKLEKLSAQKHLQQTRVRFEDLMFELVDAKIDQFMSLASSFDWCPQQVAKTCSDYIEDLIQYLDTTFSGMTNMTDPVREAVHFTSCKRIGSSLIHQWLECKKFNVIGIYNLNLDLQMLEQFANRCPIPNLAETFSELRQLVNYILSGEPDSIVDASIRTKLYPHLSNDRIITIMDKYKELSVFSSLPSGLVKLKKKALDSAMSKLKKEG